MEFKHEMQTIYSKMYNSILFMKNVALFKWSYIETKEKKLSIDKNNF